MVVFNILCGSIVIEAILTYANAFIVDKKFQWKFIFAIILGIVVSISYNLDIFEIIGMNSQIPYMGCVLTGIILSRGSNYVYHFVQLITEVKKGD